MRLAIMQPYFFPYFGYWQLINAVDRFVFYDDVQYMRRSHMTRNKMLLHSKPHSFSLPVKKAPQKALIREVYLDMKKYDKWKDKFLQSLYHAYGKAPYFQQVYPLIEGVLNTPSPELHIFLKLCIREVMQYLSIATKTTSSTDIAYDRQATAEEKIISICKQCKADTYINPIGGMDLYQPSVFEQEGIKLYFLQSETRPYPQFDLSFRSHLSIIDMLMFLSKEEVRHRLKDFQLIENEKEF